MELFVFFLLIAAFVGGVVVAFGFIQSAKAAPPESARAKFRAFIVG